MYIWFNIVFEYVFLYQFHVFNRSMFMLMNTNVFFFLVVISTKSKDVYNVYKCEVDMCTGNTLKQKQNSLSVNSPHFMPLALYNCYLMCLKAGCRWAKCLSSALHL